MDDDLAGDWEHQAIALANSKIINPATNPAGRGIHSLSLDRRMLAMKNRTKNAVPVTHTDKGNHYKFTSDSNKSSAQPTPELQNEQIVKNLQKFEKDSKKLKKKMKKERRDGRKSKACIQQ